MGDAVAASEKNNSTTSAECTLLTTQCGVSFYVHLPTKSLLSYPGQAETSNCTTVYVWMCVARGLVSLVMIECWTFCCAQGEYS